MNKNFRVTIDFSKFRDWKVVEAEDSDGVVRKHLLLPILANGIRLNDEGEPLITFLPHYGKYAGASYTLSAFIHKDVHREMVDQGLISDDDKHWAPVVGFIRPANYKRDGNDE